ncbi:dihydrolipoyl dehydrogenase [Kocuria soli]|uniref:Dihydrolipoyl dehydrogenase n=1 Tax=Kocuria soli TaxID=2485125 RepID=A0A3N4A1Y6_9MICC|nr:dihydrolipoyl dehydrogenase [Kocuria soli]ROZ62299.1 dihydrolipoyl dehydrogenase [Kocuria soli]
MNEPKQFDVVVVGAGPGGYPAAIRAAQTGLQTAVVERGDLGGICLNWGCIPTKSLLHAAELARTSRHSANFGVQYPAPEIDLAGAVAASRSVAGQLAGGVGALLAGNGVEVFRGSARLADKGEVNVTDDDGRVTRLSADHVVLATGAAPRSLPGIDLSDPGVWSYREALAPETLPESLLVIGSGAIGSEFASVYSALGSQVTLLEAADRLLPAEAPSVSQVLASELGKQGITTATGVKITSVTRTGEGPGSMVTTWEDSNGAAQETTSDAVLLAVGVKANTADLGLEPYDILRPDGSVITDDVGRTGVWGLYAIGDVAGGPCLAHKATTEAVRCIDALAGVRRVPEPEDWRDWVPKCTYTSPEVASIGITAAAARAKGLNVKSGRVPMSENGRALGAGETVGFAEVTIDTDTGHILGATLVGAGVTELIGMLSVAHAAGMTAEEFARSVIPHPTRSEAVHEAVLKALGRPINSL